MPRANRTYVRLPEHVVMRLNTIAEFRGDTVAELCFHWFVTAAKLCYEDEEGGRGLLPAVPMQATLRRAAPGSLGRTKVVRWLQGQDEWDRCRGLILDAESTVPAVLQAAAEAYIAAGGDVLAMTWPPKSAQAQAA